MADPRLATIVPLPAPDADFRVLVEVLMELSRGVDLPSTFRAVARGLTRLTHFDWLGIAWRGSGREALTLHASLSGRPDWLATSQLLGESSETLESWFLPELSRIAGPETAPLGSRTASWPVPGDIGALVSVPMPSVGGGSRREAARDVRRGALVLGRSGSQPFEPGLIPLLQPCAAHLAVILEKTEWLGRFREVNARLREQLQGLESSDASEGARPAPALSVTARPGSRSEARWTARDPAAVEAFDLVERAAATEAEVLLYGESGTGKELLARSLHRLSARSKGPFVAVNVASLSPDLVASELFGHASGAFTGARGERRGLAEEASGGTLFLDEIGDMPLSVQPVLLRFLEDGLLRRVGDNRPRVADTRVVSATHRDLLAEVVAGRFREDLYHRLSGITVYVPPLRDRPADLPLLARNFLRSASEGRYDDLPPDWWMAFRSYHWPGNVRELRNAIQSVVALSRGPELEGRFLPRPLAQALAISTVLPSSEDPYEGWTLCEVERETIRRALLATDGHRGRAASRLGITTRTLYDKVRRLGLVEPATRSRT